MSGNLTVTVLKDGASAVNNLTFDANGNTTAGGTVAMASSFLRNRIINGAMQIDQRNAGASVTQGLANAFVTDRFYIGGSAASKFTGQQSTTAPSGFTNSVLITSSSAYTVGASEAFVIAQRIEGFNVADLGWGTASAQTVTLSFRVRSSLTGTFGGSVRNSAQDRSYPFTYSISAANTWETKTITIAGDTTGTWLTDNGIGINITFSMGTGATLSGTAGAWTAGNYASATGATSVVGTSSATFYITGVQFEVGTVATPFERRLYGQELALCQRYYQYWGGSANVFQLRGYNTTGLNLSQTFTFPVSLRTSPTVTIGTVAYSNGSGLTFITNERQGIFYFAVTASGDAYVSASGTNQITFSAEL